MSASYDMPLVVEGEDKVVGGFMTLRQAAWLVGSAVAGMGLSSALGSFLPLGLSLAAGAALGFLKAPAVDAGLDRFLALFIRFSLSPKAFPWRRSGKATAQEFLGFLDVKDGMVELPGGRYSAVLEVHGSVNFALLSEPEQDQVEAWWRSFLRSLSFPVEVCVQTRYLDMSEAASQVRDLVGSLPEALRGYAMGYSEFLERLTGSVLVRRTFLVVTTERTPDRREAAAELSRKKDLLRAELSKWLDVRPLDTAETLDVLYTFYQKDRANRMRSSDADLNPVVEGISWGADAEC